MNPLTSARHLLSPTTCATLILLALVVDYLSVGPTNLRDRFAFVLAAPAVFAGFNGSPIERATVGALGSWIDKAKSAASGAYIAEAVTSHLIGAALGVLVIYTVGVLLPTRWTKRFGRFARLSWGESPVQRLNWRLWACAVTLGLMADLPSGFVGGALRTSLVLMASLGRAVDIFLFGGN